MADDKEPYVDPFKDSGPSISRDERLRGLYQDERSKPYFDGPYRTSGQGHTGRMRMLEDLIAREAPDSPKRGE